MAFAVRGTRGFRRPSDWTARPIRQFACIFQTPWVNKNLFIDGNRLMPIQSPAPAVAPLVSDARRASDTGTPGSATDARRRAALDRLLAVAPALDAAGVARLTEAEIEAEIAAARADRRGHGSADRS